MQPWLLSALGGNVCLNDLGEGMLWMVKKACAPFQSYSLHDAVNHGRAAKELYCTVLGVHAMAHMLIP